jgi:hypothetical protein
MTSFRQIEANRRNALRSTGPKTEEGKRQSWRNALRHRLSAETVIDGLEDSEDYRAFERELVLRLAWRLRRIISIETDLLKIQSDIVRERRAGFRGPPEPEEESGSSMRSPPYVFDPQQEEQSTSKITRFAAHRPCRSET